MPLAFGLMLIDRYNVYSTSLAFSISPDSGTAVAGDIITFNILVTAASGIPTGNVHIINSINNAVIGSGAIGIDGYAAISVSLSSNFYTFEIRYDGADGYFNSGISTNQTYAVNAAPTTTTIKVPLADHTNYYGYSETYPTLVHVASPYLVPEGIVNLKMWRNSTVYSEVDAYGELDVDGYALVIIPEFANAGDGYSHYIQALFYSTGSYLSSNSAAGTAGRKITPISNDVTHISLLINPDFDITSNNPIYITVTGTHLSGPSVGSIYLTSAQTIGGILRTKNLGTMIPIVGAATITILANTFVTTDDISITGHYVGDGFSHASSTSSIYTFTPL